MGLRAAAVAVQASSTSGGAPTAGEGSKHLRGRPVRQTKDLDLRLRARWVWKNFPAIPPFGGSSHQEWIAWRVAGVDPLIVGGKEGGFTGVVVASLMMGGGRQRLSEPDFIKDFEASPEKAAVLLVVSKAAEQLVQPFF